MISPELLSSVLGGGRTLYPLTLTRLNAFVALVRKWNPSINMVARSTIDAVWDRHILDSIQVFQWAGQGQKRWLDLGSGGGFPGLVVAILAADLLPDLQIVLVESDKRKSVFLTEASRQLGLSVTVLSGRVEEIEAQGADVVSARALAPLSGLCDYAARHLNTGGVCVFLKGVNASVEIEEARNRWQFELDSVQSITDGRSSVLILRGLKLV